MTSIDVTIRGAGIFGLATAWECLRLGARVQIVDPNGVAAGASGGVVGALAPHVPENWNPKKAFQLDSLLMAEAWWNEVAQAGGRDPMYRRAGRVQPLADAQAVDLAHARAKGAQDLWQGRAIWAVERAGDDPFTPISPSGWVVRDTLSAHLHPRSGCLALAAACSARGAQIVADAPDQGQVVWATGAAGLADLSRDLGAPVGQGIKGQAAVLRHDARGKPQLFAEGVHVIPHGDGTVAIGSTTERDVTDLATDGLLDDVITKARAHVPALRDAPVIQRWAGMRPRARSRAPMLGAHPTRAGVFIANGGFKIGFGMAPKSAQVLADLIVNQNDTIPAEFRVEASIPRGPVNSA